MFINDFEYFELHPFVYLNGHVLHSSFSLLWVESDANIASLFKPLCVLPFSRRDSATLEAIKFHKS